MALTAKFEDELAFEEALALLLRCEFVANGREIGEGVECTWLSGVFVAVGVEMRDLAGDEHFVALAGFDKGFAAVRIEE